ncbi:MAG TPA: hypothetical protein ENN73_01420 [Firmicutes bacterium]|nr:hypothetical protein [Bacillota bacterium]
MAIKNYLEDIVKELVTAEAEKDPALKNSKSMQEDVIAYTLNHLKPKYARTRKGYILTEVELNSEQLRAEILVEVLKAIKIVKENPKGIHVEDED